MLRTSSYTIYADLPNDSENVLLVHGYSGAYDKVSKNVANYARSLDKCPVARPLYGEWKPEPVIENTDVRPSEETLQILKKRGYLTEMNADEELAFFSNIAVRLHHMQSKLMPSYIIMPTYSCNLRCPYCFQDHIRTDRKFEHLLKVMKPEMADRLLRAMPAIEEAHGVSPESNIPRSILFFGGEPLLQENRPIVEYVMTKAQAMGQVSFSAVSNATELHHYQNLLGAGKINFIQITIDGIPEEHDKRRIFQRALITDALCDANEYLGGTLTIPIQHEAEYIISCRETTGIGGWRYFPTIRESAPDADTLAQVMQALLRAGKKQEVEKYCELPLTTLLEHNVLSDGSFETWIIPSKNRTPEEEIQAEFNKTFVGMGPDKEVIANFLYALTLYDYKRFRENIEYGATFLENHQETDGYWASRWCCGPYYVTYLCLRFLSRIKPHTSAINAAVNFLYTQQNNDGGWGFGQDSDPLSTSLALLGLHTIHNVKHDNIRNALHYLHGSTAMSKESRWEKVDFIRLGDNLPYGSRTITTMYVLKATLACITRDPNSIECIFGGSSE